MDTVAFLYPGQGSQRVGMGADLLESEPGLFERYFSSAEAAAGLPIRRYCLEGPIESLTRTEVAQPALFALSLALTDVARDLGLRPHFVAGHSLGEYTAAVASGALDPEDGMRLVARRGRLMAEIQAERPGAMAAIMGLDADALAGLCATASAVGLVALANLNAPNQIVVSGEEAGVERAIELARGAGAGRAMRLQVGAAFHSPLMEPVQARMAEAMERVAWRDPLAPLVANVSGEILTDGEAIHRALLAQITSPVRWVDCVRALLRSGCTSVLEIGAGRVLAGLVRQIDREADAYAADSPGKLAAFVQERPALIAR
jgi:[acyl-carrier-protein] S-malonyltransferase